MNDWTRTYQAYERVAHEVVNVAPHVLTEQVSYTIPQNTYAVIQNIESVTVRTSAATTPGFYRIRVTILLGGAISIPILELLSIDNTVNAISTRQLPSSIFLRPGDIIKIWTGDMSTGGTVNYSAWILLTTYL